MNETAGAVTASVLNLREEPSTASAVLGKLARGTRVRVLETAGAWYQVDAGGREGFVHGDWIVLLDDSPAAGFLFVKGPGTTSPMLEALRRKRFEEFASRYNGPGRAAEYGGRIQGYFEAFEAVHPPAPAPA